MIKKELLLMKDNKYYEFHSKLCKNVNLIGIRIPILRKYAKKLYLENIYDIDTLLSKIDCEYYEEIMLKGMIIGMDKKISINIFLKRIADFVPLIDNWAVCDTFCASLKLTKKYPDEVFNFLLQYFQSNKEFEVRFAVVMFLDYFINDKYLEKVFSLIENLKISDYYVEMAISWALSVCLIDYFNETVSYLKKANLSKFVYRKTIQKAIESYRISEEKKEYLKKIRNCV